MPLLSNQAPEAPAAAGQPSGFLAWVWEVAQRPGVVETLVALLLVLTLTLLWLRLSSIVRRARSRAAIRDYLLGVEQALSGDLPGAEKRLQRVLAEDPENHYARLLYAKVLAERGEPAAAHKHHVFLQRAFAVESARNDLWLARSLLLVGHHAEAAEAAERAARQSPQDVEAQEFLFRARLAAGEHQAAAKAGQRTLALLPAGEAQKRLAGEVASVLARAGLEQVRIGELSVAQQCLHSARQLQPAGSEVALLEVRLEAARHGDAAVMQRLLGPGREQGTPALSEGSSLPMALTPSALAVLQPRSPGLQALAALMPRHRWRCEACGNEMPHALPDCPRCHARGRVAVTEPQLFRAVESPTQTLDAIEENRAFVQRTVRLALEGATEAERQDACALLLELRDKAVEDLLEEAWHRPGDANTAVGLLRAMGPTITPTLFVAAQNLDKKRLLPIGSRSPAALVGRIVQGFDREALPHVEELFTKAPPEYRKILIDYFLGLADLEKFQIVLEWFPPLEILQRLNKADDAVLVRFLQAVPGGHFVAEALLLEAAFYREDAVLRALPQAVDAPALEALLVRRGPTRTLTRELLLAIDDPELAEAALRILRQFGERVLDHVLAAFADEDRPPEVRRQLGELLTGLGPAAVERLCSAFGPEPTPIDEALQRVLAAMGDAAVPALGAAYCRSSVLERFAIGLLPRHNNRRVQILRALATVASPAALDTMRSLRETEKDPNLRLRLQQLLHQGQSRQDDDGGGAHGQVG